MSIFSCPQKTGDQTGFTLIELLVVMAIIAILAALSISSFQSSQTRARDGQRKSDLEQISHALEAYFNDYGEYPDSDTDNKIVGCNGDTATPPISCTWGETWADAKGTVYMVELPADPRTYLNYSYDSNGDDYQIYTRLENSQDKEVPTIGEDPAVYNISCGTLNCNYGVSSSNTTPEDGRMIVTE